MEVAIRLVLSCTERYNRHDSGSILDLLSDDCVFESAEPAPSGTVHAGKESISVYLEGCFSGPSQPSIEVEEIFGMGYRCILRYRRNWIDPAGMSRSVRGIDLFTVRNQKICEWLSYAKASQDGAGTRPAKTEDA
jgi:hypothetical protein